MDKESIKKKIRSFASLEDNWDGYGANALSEYTIIGILNVVDLLPYDLEIKQPWIVPGQVGVQLEWQNGKKEVEIEITDKLVGFLQVDMSQEKEEDRYIESELFISDGLDKIQKKVRELLGWLVN